MARKATTHPVYGTSMSARAVDYDGRISFAISFFATEDEARYWGARIRKAGVIYNGGWFHGKPCGRDATWDKEIDGKKVFAVTH